MSSPALSFTLQGFDSSPAQCRLRTDCVNLEGNSDVHGHSDSLNKVKAGPVFLLGFFRSETLRQEQAGGLKDRDTAAAGLIQPAEPT